MSTKSTTTQRRSTHNSTGSSSRPVIYPDIDPAPTPWPAAQLLALLLIIGLSLLQFLPATHFRDPSDPFRNWIPFQPSSSSSSLSSSGASSDENSSLMTVSGEDGTINIVSWMDCLDLRALSVLANSTLSNSRYPRVQFHFFLPEGHDRKVSYYKLKVLFPHSNLQVLGQKEVEEKITTANSGEQYAGSYLEEIAPFVIPSVYPSLSKFVYISPSVIVKGKIEELLAVNMSSYVIAAAEDCSRRLNSFINTDVLDVIQRSALKPWIPLMPYVKNACTPDLHVLLIDAKIRDRDILEAILWWRKVLDNSKRSGTNLPVALALYNRYVKLSASWMVSDSSSSEINGGNSVIRYDGPTDVCSDSNSHSGHGDLWKHFLPPNSERIIGN